MTRRQAGTPARAGAARRAAVGAVFACAVPWFGGAPAAAQVAACFAPDALAHRPGEEIPRRGAPGAAVAPPRTDPAAHPPVAGRLAGSIRRVDLPPGEKLVALTFDLCEAPGEIAGYDGRIVDLLRAEAVAATFFAGGKWLMTHRIRAAQLVADPLFEVGTHSWTHANLEVATGARMRAQVRDAEAALAEARADPAVAACPRRPAPAHGLFRFPYGACSAESLRFVNDSGLLAVQWDVDSGDPAHIGARDIAAAVLARVRPGSIVLMHANGRGWHTAEALRLLIPALRERGYRFATVSALIAAGTAPITSPVCFNNRPGDTAIWRPRPPGGPADGAPPPRGGWPFIVP